MISGLIVVHRDTNIFLIKINKLNLTLVEVP